MSKAALEAVAALLYNSIYDLSHPTEGVWCIADRRDDPAYLAFAESLLQAVRDKPDASDHVIIQAAEQFTNQKGKAGHSWETIVIDQEYFNLPKRA